jgi:hypothetical protein
MKMWADALRSSRETSVEWGARSGSVVIVSRCPEGWRPACARRCDAGK